MMTAFRTYTIRSNQNRYSRRNPIQSATIMLLFKRQEHWANAWPVMFWRTTTRDRSCFDARQPGRHPLHQDHTGWPETQPSHRIDLIWPNLSLVIPSLRFAGYWASVSRVCEWANTSTTMIQDLRGHHVGDGLPVDRWYDLPIIASREGTDWKCPWKDAMVYQYTGYNNTSHGLD